MTYEKVKCWICDKIIDGILLNDDDTTPSQIDPVHEDCAKAKIIEPVEVLNVRLLIPRWLMGSWDKVMNTTNPTLDQSEAMLRFVIFGQLDKVYKDQKSKSE